MKLFSAVSSPVSSASQSSIPSMIALPSGHRSKKKRAWFKANYPTDYQHEVLIPDTETFSGHYHKIKIP